MTEQKTFIPYDPDFDETNSAVGMSPRVMFAAGVIMAVLALGTIGFFILLKILFI